MNAEDCLTHRPFIDVPGEGGIYYPWICPCPDDLYVRASIPSCGNCIPQTVESHPTKQVVRCANCKEWLAW